MNEIIEKYTSLYNDNVELLNQHSSSSINALRDDALAYFKEKGVPTKKVENYKYTDLKPFFENGFNSNFDYEKVEVDLNELFHCNVPEINAHMVLMVNGRFYKGNKNLDLPKGVIICGFEEAQQKYPEIVNAHYGKYSEYKKDSLAALNTAFAQDGLFIYIPKGVVLERPVQVINLLRANKDLMVHPRNLIICEENSQAKVVICDHTLNPHHYFTNAVTEIVVKENAVFDIYNMQDSHLWSTTVNSTFLHQEKNSNALTAVITLNGGFVRNNQFVKLDGEHCENHTLGIYVTDQDQHVDNYTDIDHAKPNCTSNQLYKGVLNGSSTGAFTGKILVQEDAQKTLAFQSNNNVLLSETAKMNTKPQLEIYADDVKCSHGATVGQINEEAMFYMQARGISENEARLMLTFGFMHEVIGRIRVEPLKERINDLVERRLRGELTRCSNCMLDCR